MSTLLGSQTETAVGVVTSVSGSQGSRSCFSFACFDLSFEIVVSREDVCDKYVGFVSFLLCLIFFLGGGGGCFLPAKSSAPFYSSFFPLGRNLMRRNIFCVIFPCILLNFSLFAHEYSELFLVCPFVRNPWWLI